jgi:two-component system sensor histidine kinase KdpD
MPEDNTHYAKTPELWLEETAPHKNQTCSNMSWGMRLVLGKLSIGSVRAFAALVARMLCGPGETHGRAGIAELASRLEAMPQRQIQYKGASFGAMDIDAILERRPQVVWWMNWHTIEGSRHGKRYEDVMDLLDVRIDILFTMNVQHIESLNSTVLNITGVQVRETVPDRSCNG